MPATLKLSLHFLDSLSGMLMLKKDTDDKNLISSYFASSSLKKKKALQYFDTSEELSESKSRQVKKVIKIK